MNTHRLRLRQRYNFGAYLIVCVGLSAISASKKEQNKTHRDQMLVERGAFEFSLGNSMRIDCYMLCCTTHSIIYTACI